MQVVSENWQVNKHENKRTRLTCEAIDNHTRKLGEQLSIQMKGLCVRFGEFTNEPTREIWLRLVESSSS